MLFLLLLLVTISTSTSEECDSVTQEDCESLTSEYESYRACMERRTKRSTDCYNDNCDSSCSSSSCDTCNNNCCSQKSSCTTYTCCHQTCRAECKSNACRTHCKRKCQDRLSNQEETVQQTGSNQQHNITTIIKLNNMINNTNVINLPITLNSTILNNITNEAQLGGAGERCCLTVGPRQCVPQKDFPFMRCFHIRRKECGYICSAPIVHYQRHEICDNNVNVQQPCRQHIVYVPQPQPRCGYTSNWPYVTCGNREQQTCDGCYNHYIKRDDITRCSSFCYDDGYGAGPYYRQGPFYRPGFAHVPSCYQTGFCEGYGDVYGYGGYQGFPMQGFPYAYPPQTYPSMIEECQDDKCANSTVGGTQWINESDKLINMQMSVERPRNGRYAEIKIKNDKGNDVSGSTEKKETTSEQTTFSQT